MRGKSKIKEPIDKEVLEQEVEKVMEDAVKTVKENHEKVKAKITAIDFDKKRISLSMRALLPVEEEVVEADEVVATTEAPVEETPETVAEEVAETPVEETTEE